MTCASGWRIVSLRGLGVGEVGVKCLDGVRGNSGERVVYGGVLVVARSSETEVHLVRGFLTDVGLNRVI